MIRLGLWKYNVGENLFDVHELYCNWGIRSFQKLVKRDEGTERMSTKETDINLLERSALPGRGSIS